MKTKKQGTNKAFSLKELCRKALTVLLTVAMVTMNTPFAYAAEAGATGAEPTQATKPSTSTETNASTQETGAQANSAEPSATSEQSTSNTVEAAPQSAPEQTPVEETAPTQTTQPTQPTQPTQTPESKTEQSAPATEQVVHFETPVPKEFKV